PPLLPNPTGRLTGLRLFAGGRGRPPPQSPSTIQGLGTSRSPADPLCIGTSACPQLSSARTGGVVNLCRRPLSGGAATRSLPKESGRVRRFGRVWAACLARQRLPTKSPTKGLEG